MENKNVITDPIDKITLEFLMNRSKYKKYIEKTDPHKYRENENHLQKIWKYRNRISKMTDDLLKNPEMMVTLDVSDCFHNYMRTLIRYFEMKDMEKHDSDVLFDDIDDDDNDIYKTSPTIENDLNTIKQQQIAYNILPRHLDISIDSDEKQNIIDILQNHADKKKNTILSGDSEDSSEFISNTPTPIMQSFWSGRHQSTTTNLGKETVKKSQSNMLDFSVKNHK